MREIALHILDIAENSVKAKATVVCISIELKDNGYLYLEIADDGTGMDEDFLNKVTDPFTTTRNTRKVGLGLPLLKQLSEGTGGAFSIESRLGEGTTVRASFNIKHIDCVPLGDIPSTIVTLIRPNVDFVLDYTILDRHFEFSTLEVKEELGAPELIDSPEVLKFVGDYLKENVLLTNGGLEL